MDGCADCDQTLSDQRFWHSAKFGLQLKSRLSRLCCPTTWLQGLPGAIFHWGPGQGLQNWAKEWRWPNFEMSNQGRAGHAEQV